MNSRQRMQAAFAHTEPDRVPVGEIDINEPVASYILGREAWVGFGGSHRGKRANEMRQAGCMDEYYAREAADRVELTRKLELDFLLVSPHPKQERAPERIAENVWKFTDPESGAWSIYRYLPESDIYSEVDCSLLHDGMPAFERLVQHLEATQPSLDGVDFGDMAWIIREIGGELFIVGDMDIGIPLYSAAGPLYMEAVALRPDLVEHYLDAQLAHVLYLLEAQVRLGIDAVLGGEDWAGTRGPFISPAHFRRLVLPRLQKLVQACHRHGIPYIKHTDGNITLIERELLEDSGIDGYHAIEPAAGMDIGDLKRRHGARLTLLGNVDCGHTLCTGTPEEVAAETRRVIGVAAPGGGFVLTSSNSIHSGVRVDNFLTMLETARRYGTYPVI